MLSGSVRVFINICLLSWYSIVYRYKTLFSESMLYLFCDKQNFYLNTFFSLCLWWSSYLSLRNCLKRGIFRYLNLLRSTNAKYIYFSLLLMTKNGTSISLNMDTPFTHRFNAVQTEPAWFFQSGCFCFSFNDACALDF